MPETVRRSFPVPITFCTSLASIFFIIFFGSYCDCFAAGVYCTDPCSCQGCFNKPEHKKTVVETREQIESRNPLAFAPKIVQRIPELPPNHAVLSLFCFVLLLFFSSAF